MAQAKLSNTYYVPKKIENKPVKIGSDANSINGAQYLFGKLGSGAASMGIGIYNLMAGIGDQISGDQYGAQKRYRENSAHQFSEKLDAQYDANGFMQFMGSAMEGIGQNIPRMALAFAIPVAGPWVAGGAAIAGYAGQGVEEAYQKTGNLGANEYIYGFYSGTMDTALDTIGGKLGGWLPSGKVGASAVGKSLGLSTAKKVLLGGASEFAEEFIESFTDVAMQRALKIDPNASVSMKEALYAGAVGFASGGILSGIGTGGTNLKNMAIGDRVMRSGETDSTVATAKQIASAYKSNKSKMMAEPIRILSENVAFWDNLKDKNGTTARVVLGNMKVASEVMNAMAQQEGTIEKVTQSPEKFLPAAKAMFGEQVTLEDLKNPDGQYTRGIALIDYATGLVNSVDQKYNMAAYMQDLDNKVNDSTTPKLSESVWNGGDAVYNIDGGAVAVHQNPNGSYNVLVRADGETNYIQVDGKVSLDQQGVVNALDQIKATMQEYARTETQKQGEQAQKAEKEIDTEKGEKKAEKQGKKKKSKKETPAVKEEKKQEAKEEQKEAPAEEKETAKEEPRSNELNDTVKKEAATLVEQYSAEVQDKARKFVKDVDMLSAERRVAIYEAIRTGENVENDVIAAVASYMDGQKGLYIFFNQDMKGIEGISTLTKSVKGRMIALTRGVKAIRDTVSHEIFHDIVRTGAGQVLMDYALANTTREALENTAREYGAFYGADYDAFKKEQKETDTTKIVEAFEKSIGKEGIIFEEAAAKTIGAKLGTKEFMTLMTRSKSKFQTFMRGLRRFARLVRTKKAERPLYRETMRLENRYLASAASAGLITEVQSRVDETRYSIQSFSNALGIDATRNEDGTITFTLDGKEVKKVTESMVKESRLYKFIELAKKNGFISEEDAEKQAEFVKSMMQMLIESQDAQLTYAFSGSMLFSAVKDNADKQYKKTIDFEAVCKKTEQMVAVMSEAMMRKGGGLTLNEINALYSSVIESKETVPCPACYVFARWIGIGGLLGNIADFQNRYRNYTREQLEEEAKRIESTITSKEGETLGKARSRLISKYASDIEKLISQRNDDIDKKDTKKILELDKQYEALNKSLVELRALSWIREVRMAEGYKEVPKNILFNLRAGEEFAGAYPETWKYRTGQGAYYGKAITPYTDERLGEVTMGMRSGGVKDTINIQDNPFKEIGSDFDSTQNRIIKAAQNEVKRQNLRGGVRFQSFSDFRYEYALDYIQALFELQALGAGVQTYTKVVEAVNFLASTGAFVNMSLMPDGKGVKDGKLIFNNIIGINADSAFALQKEFETAGTILMTISDEHTIAAMADDRIYFIIPYHKSGGRSEVIREMLKALGIEAADYEDFSFVQSETFPKQGTNAAADLRAKILTEDQFTPNEQEQSILDENPFLQSLYDRKYNDKSSALYGVNMTVDDTKQIFPYEYWDATTTFENADENGRRYLAYCETLGVKPKFSGDSNGNHDFTGYDGYWKLLIDRRMYGNDGKYLPMQSVNATSFNFDQLDATKAYEKFGDAMSKKADLTKTNEIVDRVFPQNERDETRYALTSPDKYDYTKPFAEQIDDYMKKDGSFPAGDTFLVGATPKVYQDIGLLALPMTINKTHVDYALYGTKNADHFIGKDLLKQLPEALKHPVAIIASESKPSTSVVVLLEMQYNGKQVIAPVYIDGEGTQNGISIDSNAITSIYARSNAISKLLNNALQAESKGEIGVFYLDKAKATTLMTKQGVIMPGALSLDNGFNHSIREKGSPVKPRLQKIFESQQFKRWFGKSKVVNKDGTPRVVYHGSVVDFDTFDKSKIRSVDYDAPFNGFWFSTDEDTSPAFQNAKYVKAFYLSVQNPAPASVWRSVVKEVRKDGNIRDGARSEADEIRMRLQDKGYDGVIWDAPKTVTPENIREYKETGETTIESVRGNKFDLRYDEEAGIGREYYHNTNDEVAPFVTIEDYIKDNDDSETVIVVFEPTQIKSATDNIGTFDVENDDTRYSITPAQDRAYNSLAEKYKAGTATKEETAELERMVRDAAQGAGYDVEAYHGSEEDFTVFKRGDRGDMWFSSTQETAYNNRANMYHTYLRISDPYRVTHFVGMDTKFDPQDVVEKGKQGKHDGAIVRFVIDSKYAERNLDILDRMGVSATDKFGDSFRFLPSTNEREYLAKDGESLADFIRRGMDDGLYEWYVVYDADQIKSADPVTYDNNGNIIPLSERFNSEKDDIRYSLSSYERARGRQDKTFTETEAKEMVRGLKEVLNDGQNKPYGILVENGGKMLYDRMNNLWRGDFYQSIRSMAEELAQNTTYNGQKLSSFDQADMADFYEGFLLDQYITKGTLTDLGKARLNAQEEKRLRERAQELTTNAFRRSKSAVAIERIAKSLSDMARKRSGVPADAVIAQEMQEAAKELAEIGKMGKFLTGQAKAEAEAGTNGNEFYGIYYGEEVRSKLRLAIIAYERYLETLGEEGKEGDAKAYLDMMKEIYNGKGALTADELYDLSQIMRVFRTVYTRYGTVMWKGKRENTSSLAEIFVKKEKDYAAFEKERKGKFRDTLKAVGKLFQEMFMFNAMTPKQVFKTLDYYDPDGFFTNMWAVVQEGRAKADADYATMFSPLMEYIKEHKGYEKRLASGTMDYQGKKIYVGQAISLYLTTFREQAKLGLETNGFYLKDGRETINFAGRDVGEIRAEIESQLTDDDKGYIELLVGKEYKQNKTSKDSLFGRARALKEQTDFQMYGASNVIDGFYFPIIRDESTIRQDIENYQKVFSNVQTLVGRSFNKNTAEGAKNALYIEDVTYIADDHAKGVANYANLAIPYRTFNAVWNQNVDSDGVNTNLKTVIDRSVWNINGSAQRYITKLLSDVAGARRSQDVGDKLYNYLRSSYVSAALGLNLSSILKQWGSFGSALIYVSPSDLAKGIALGKVDYDDVVKYSNVAKGRLFQSQRYLAEGNIDRNAFRGSRFGQGLQKVSETLTAPMEMMDKVVSVGRMWNAARAFYQRTEGLDINSEENKRKAGKLLDEIINNTQSTATQDTRSAFQRSKNPLIQTFTMFTSDAVKMLSYLYEGVAGVAYTGMRQKMGLATEAEVKQAQKFALRSGAAFLTSLAIVVSIIQLIKTLLKKKREENLAWDIGKDAIGEAMGILPFVNQVSAFFMDGYEVKSFVMQDINDLASGTKGVFTALGKAASGEEVENYEWARPFRKVVYTTGNIFGLPIRNANNYMTGLLKWISPSAGYGWESAFNKPTYSKDLSDAVAKGNDKLAMKAVELQTKAKLGEESEIASEMLALYKEGYTISLPSAGTTKKTEVKSFNAYMNRADKAAGKMVDTAIYQDLTDEEKASAISNLYAKYADVAKNKTVRAKSVLLMDAGTLMSAAAKISNFENTKKNPKSDQVAAYLNTLDISNEEKFIILWYVGYKNKTVVSQMEKIVKKSDLSDDDKQAILASITKSDEE